MRTSLASAVILSAASCAYALNDWSVPCFQGVCAYDVAGSQTNAAATLKVVRPATFFLFLYP